MSPDHSPAPALPRLYSELASWWPLLSNPQDYVEEAGFVWQTLCEASTNPIGTVLELGSGGGNNASHLSKHCRWTLVDYSSSMLAVSERLNPECEHLLGDMRSIRLNRLFDAIFIHDAIMYMTTKEDLHLAIETAFLHCRPGGVALFMPDFIKQTFRSGLHHGGRDGATGGLRYIEWTLDSDPVDSVYTVDFVYLLREGNGPVRVEHDVHVHGIFSREVWLEVLSAAGFDGKRALDPYGREVFVGRKPITVAPNPAFEV